MRESFERGVVRTMYPGSSWKNIIDRVSEDRVLVIYSQYIQQLKSLNPNLKKEQNS